MREPITDLVLLALLVLFFGVQQRNRPERHFRIWLAGWSSILASVALWEWGRQHAPLSTALDCLRLDFLIFGGLAFVFSFVTLRNAEAPIIIYASIIGTVACFATDFVLIQTGGTKLLLFAVILGHATAAVAAVRLLLEPDRALRIVVLSLCVIYGCVMSWALLVGLHRLVPNLILSEIFLCAGILFATLRNSDRLGRLLGALGFVAWSAGFVLSNLPETSVVLQVVQEIWHVPKHLVGFGMILILFGRTRDEQEEMSQRHRTLYDEFRLLYERNPHPMWIYDPRNGRYLSVNEAAVHQYGYTVDEFREMTIFQIRPQEDIPLLSETLAHPDDLVTQTWRHTRKDGTVFHADVTGHDIVFEGMSARFVLAIDTTQREELHRQLRYRAQHDVLTDLPNRSVLEEELPLVLDQCGRSGEKAALLTIDVDRFKLVNDTFGHLTGDECLKEIARRLSSGIHDAHTVARTGGEEFSVLVAGLTSAADVQTAANAMLALFSDPIQTVEQEVRVSVSIGVALYPDDAAGPEDMRKRCDQALYFAKRNGGNQVVFARKEVYGPIEQARSVDVCLREALRKRAFHLAFQPIFDRTARIAHFEALIRTDEPMLRELGPAVFIPIAEESGLITAIDHWVLHEACRQLEAWQQQGIDIRPVAINVSARQLAQTDFAVEVSNALKANSIPRGMLTMELTETTVMTHLEPVAKIMTELSDLGIEFAIDDFGTGYSSLARLNELPLTSLKIDRSLVERIGTQSGLTIVEAVMKMARSLNLTVIAEGVETEGQYRTLCDIGCDLFQGYLFSKPLVANQVIPALNQ